MSRPYDAGDAPLPGPGPGGPDIAPVSRRTPSSSLAEALRNAGMTLDGRSGPGSDTPSEEDYEENIRPALATPTVLRRRHQRHSSSLSESVVSQATAPATRVARRDSGIYIVPDDDKSLQQILLASSERARDTSQPAPPRLPGWVFTRQFSAFDRQHPLSTNSPFHGFYTLFWLGVALYVVKISAENWVTYGSPIGSGNILKIMFSRDVFVLLLSDGIMCGLTGVSWLIQLLVFHDYLDWDRSGWVIQNIWQLSFVVSVIELTLLREWEWPSTVYFSMHGIVMLMKMHSYSFYNGHLSTVYKKRNALLAKLKLLDLAPSATTPSQTDPPVSALSTDHLEVPPSAAHRRKSTPHVTTDEGSDIDRISQAIASGQPLDNEQVVLFERIIKWEVDALADELRGTATKPERAYPNNLTFENHYKWIPLPTLVYELEYPRSESINWAYVAEKLAAMVGVLFVMIQISQHSMYPVVMRTVEMKESGMPLAERFAHFPWILSDLMFPFVMEYLLTWYLIWETILNALAEVTCFADRSFYDAWWNSVSWDQFARDWNRPVHVFLLRHVYHSSISTLKVKKHTATLITFFLSACVHELIMWCLFKKLRGYLLVMQMCQLPLVKLSRTRWLRGRKTLGNLIFWLGIFTGPSLLCSLYLIL